MKTKKTASCITEVLPQAFAVISLQNASSHGANNYDKMIMITSVNIKKDISFKIGHQYVT